MKTLLTFLFAVFGKAAGIAVFAVSYFAFIASSIRIQTQNVPTVRSRRFSLHTQFCILQYILLVIFLFVASMTASTFWLHRTFFMSPLYVMSIEALLLMVIGTPFVILVQKYHREQFLSELGLMEKPAVYTYAKVVRRFYWSLLTNIFLFETFLFCLMSDSPKNRSVFGIDGLIFFGGGGMLVLFLYYAGGRSLLPLCLPDSMEKYPPLINDPIRRYAALCNLKSVKRSQWGSNALVDSDHRKEAGWLYYIHRYSLPILILCAAGFIGFMFYQSNVLESLRRDPLPLDEVAPFLMMIAITLAYGWFLRRICRYDGDLPDLQAAIDNFQEKPMPPEPEEPLPRSIQTGFWVIFLVYPAVLVAGHGLWRLL